MRMMVLHSHQRHAPFTRQQLGLARGSVIGMQIAYNRVWRGRKKIHQILDRPLKNLARS